MLAAMRPQEVSRILTTKGMARFTPRTVASPAQMAIELNDVRAAGYAVDDEEYSAGLRCVAAAVLDEHGEPIGAISVSGPAIRVTRERLPRLGCLVRAFADELTLELGGVPAARRLPDASTLQAGGCVAPIVFADFGRRADDGGEVRSGGRDGRRLWRQLSLIAWRRLCARGIRTQGRPRSDRRRRRRRLRRRP